MCSELVAAVPVGQESRLLLARHSSSARQPASMRLRPGRRSVSAFLAILLSCFGHRPPKVRRPDVLQRHPSIR